MSNIYLFGFNDEGQLVRVRHRLGKFTGETPTTDQLAQVQASLGMTNGGVGAGIASTLIAWALAKAYTVTDTTNKDAQNVLLSGPVLWPDGTAGVYTLLVKDANQPIPNSWSITYAALGGHTVTQPTITRDTNGDPLTTPAMTVT